MFRPDVIAHRKHLGHWEADLVLFRQKHGPANVATMFKSEQVAPRMQPQGPANRVSHETTYRFAYPKAALEEPKTDPGLCVHIP